MNNHIQVLALSGSLRSGSSNTHLLNAAGALAPADTIVRIHPLGDLPMFNEDIESEAFAAGPVRSLLEAVQASDALLLAGPEYNHSFSAVLKNAIDWLSRAPSDWTLAGMPTALIGATTGRWGTRLSQAAMRQVLLAVDAKLITSANLYLADSKSAFDGEGNLVDPEARSALSEVVSELAIAADRRRRTFAPIELRRMAPCL